MKYRQFCKTEWNISALSLMVMPLSAIGEDGPASSIGDLGEVIRHAIDGGVNYLDLGYPYHVKRPQDFYAQVRLALAGGYREKVKVALRLPSLLIRSPRDFDRHLEEQMQQARLKQADFCLLEGLNRDIWPRMKELGAIAWAEQAMWEGRIKELGFVFHDDHQYLRSVLQGYDHWAVAVFQYSYMDYRHHPGLSGLQMAAQHGLPVIAEDPFKGGRLLKEPPEEAAALLEEAVPQRTLAEWALLWGWHHPEVASVLAEISTLQQAKEYLALAEKAEAGMLEVKDQLLLARVREAYQKGRSVPCPACYCCMPCPQGIDAPRIMELYNEALMFVDPGLPRFFYRLEGHRPEDCSECLLCTEKCPREYPIVELLKKTEALFSNNASGCGAD